ncbi:MAG: DUF6515 family protein [Limisphaerales bacterium]
MKRKFQNRSWLLSAATLAALFALSPALRADWGSIRANNRSPSQRAKVEHRENERRHVDIEADRHHAFYWSGFCAGMTVSVLPPGYVQASVGAVGYYYYDGVYYQPTTEGNYSVVAPPVGAIVPQLPSGAEAIAVGPTTYYYAGWAFYVQQPNGFAVMPAPLGVTVTMLPPGAAPVVIKGVLYYLANDVYYLPVMQGGVTVYVTAHP